MSGLHGGGGLSYAPCLDEGGLIFQGGLKEVNFKRRVVYKVTGYAARRGEIGSTCTVRDGDGGRAQKSMKQMKGGRKRRANCTAMFLMVRRFKLGDVTNAMCKHGNTHLPQPWARTRNWTQRHASLCLPTHN